MQVLDDIADQCSEVYAFLAQGQLSCVGHGQGVQIADQPSQMLDLGQQRLHLGLAGVDDAVADRMQSCLQHRQWGAQLVGDGGGRGQAFRLQRFQRINHAVEGIDHLGHLAMGIALDGSGGQVATLHARSHFHHRGQRTGDAAGDPETHGHAERQADGQTDDQRPFLAKQAVAFPVLGVDLKGSGAVLQILGLQRFQLGLDGAWQMAIELAVLQLGKRQHANRQRGNGQQHGRRDPQTKADPDAVQSQGHRR